MSDGLSETPKVIPTTCGFCYPDLDFDSYVHVPCPAHSPDLKGADDEIARARHGTEWVTGTGEAGGHSNRDACEQIHHQHPRDRSMAERGWQPGDPV